MAALGSAVPGIKVSTTEVSFDANSDFNLSFFDSSTPPPSVVSKKEPEFLLSDRDTEGLFESMTSESLFSPVSIKKEDLTSNTCTSSQDSNSLFEPMGADYSSPFTNEDSKYTSFSDAAAPSSARHAPQSPLPALSPKCEPIAPSRAAQHSKPPIIIKSGKPSHAACTAARIPWEDSVLPPPLVWANINHQA